MNTQTHHKSISRKDEVKHCSICGQEGHNRVFHKPLQTERVCCVCKAKKPITEFAIRKAYNTNGFARETRQSCCRLCDLDRSAKRYRSDFEKRFGYLLASIKARCADKGTEVSIIVSDLLDKLKQQNSLCFYSKQPLSLDTGNNAVSIDRINPFGPYSKENTVLVCWLVNHMKRQQTHNEFVALCRLIADNH